MVERVPFVLRSYQDIMLLHKWRRAPHGTGRFWSEVQSCLKAIIHYEDDDAELLQAYGPSVARDHNISADAVTNDPAKLRALLQTAVDAEMGHPASFRRWRTYALGGVVLDKLWHSAILSPYRTHCLLQRSWARPFRHRGGSH